jgi:hypothetical protein
MRSQQRSSRATVLVAGSVSVLIGACGLDRMGLVEPPAAGGNGTGAGAGTGAEGGSLPTTSATAGSSAATTTSTSGGGAAGGAPPGEQDCLNEQDDDGDGLTDCDDAVDCAAYACVLTSTDPMANAYLALGMAPGPCPAPSTLRTLKECDGCVCSPSPGTCTVTAIGYYEAGCATYAATWIGPYCLDTDGPERWFRATSSPNGDAICSAVNPTPGASPLDSCSLPSGGHCADGGTCLPAGFAAAADQCVLLPAGSSCVAPYGAERVVYEGAASTCSCGCAPSGAQGCAAASLVVSANTNDCGNQSSLVLADGNCNGSGPMQSVLIPQGVGTIACSSAVALSDQSPPQILCCLP